MGITDRFANRTEDQKDRTWQWVLGGAFFVVFIIAWELFGQVYGGLLFAPFSETLDAFLELITSRELYEALWRSNQAMLIGFGMAVLVGVPLGLLLGRFQAFERFVDVYLNILIVTPMSAIIPLIILAIGLGLSARVLVVFFFAFPIIAVNTRTGLKSFDTSLIEMAKSLGANERQLWRKILLPGAAPSMMAGIRLGLGRSLSGMVVVELLLIAVGLGRLILKYQGFFQPEKTYAVIIVIIIEVVIVMSIANRVESRLTAWQPRT
jgi:NitT/TauT family transport system permease protein